MKKRLDQLLVEKGFFTTRSKSAASILAGQILINEQKIDKAGASVDENSSVRILGNKNPYVSRGGLKLEKALDEFKVSAQDKICLDIGASTGGFTDCLLQRGASKIYAVDVGYGQIDLKIRNNPKVVVIEKTNARYLTPEILYGQNTFADNFASLAVIDVSFISILKILPALKSLVKDNADIVSLVKPQFEAGKKSVGKGGIIKDKSVHDAVLNRVIAESEIMGYKFIASTTSPITGADGNIEYFIHLSRGSPWRASTTML